MDNELYTINMIELKAAAELFSKLAESLATMARVANIAAYKANLILDSKNNKENNK